MPTHSNIDARFSANLARDFVMGWQLQFYTAHKGHRCFKKYSICFSSFFSKSWHPSVVAGAHFEVARWQSSDRHWWRHYEIGWQPLVGGSRYRRPVSTLTGWCVNVLGWQSSISSATCRPVVWKYIKHDQYIHDHADDFQENPTAPWNLEDFTNTSPSQGGSCICDRSISRGIASVIVGLRSYQNSTVQRTKGKFSANCHMTLQLHFCSGVKKT